MLLRLLLVLAIVLAVLAVGAWRRRTEGAVRSAEGHLTPGQLRAVGLDAVGPAGGAVLFGSPTCAPCTTVRQVLERLRADRPGFRWSYVDAADHLDLADAHRVRRVPTLLLLDEGGRVLARTSGVPDGADLQRTLASRGAVGVA